MMLKITVIKSRFSAEMLVNWVVNLSLVCRVTTRLTHGDRNLQVTKCREKRNYVVEVERRERGRQKI